MLNTNNNRIWARVGYGAMYMVLAVAALAQLFPLVWLFMFSLKDNQEVFGNSPLALPTRFRWENYEKVWTEGNINLYFLNSVWYTVAAVALTVLLASFAVFAITRMNWRLSKPTLGLFMVGLMIPVHAALVPLFQMFHTAGLINHPLSIILTYTAFNLPITVMILLGFYYTLPREIEEAAIMDGCSVHRLFLSVVLPMTSSVIITAVIINMIYNWNEFVFVNTFISSDELKTLTVGIQNFIGQYQADWGAIGATLMISIFPVLLAFFALSNRIAEGLAAGALKG